MENIDLLGNLGKIAGIAGIALGILFLTFQSIIQKNIFPNLSKEHGYKVIRMIVVACTMIAVLGIGAWVYANQQEKDGQKIEVRVEGRVTDVNGNGLGNVEVSVQDLEGLKDITDSEGKYVLKFVGNGNSDYTLAYKRSGFSGRTRKINVDFKEGKRKAEDDMQLTALVVHDVSDEADDKKNNPANIEADDPEDWTPVNPGRSTNQVGNATINLIYDPDGSGCNLNINISIGGINFNPQTNPVQLIGVRPGKQTYAISGMAYCPGGQCAVFSGVNQELLNTWSAGDPQVKKTLSFFNEINVVAGATYYLVFDPSSCLAGIADADTYTYFKSLSF